MRRELLQVRTSFSTETLDTNDSAPAASHGVRTEKPFRAVPQAAAGCEISILTW